MWTDKTKNRVCVKYPWSTSVGIAVGRINTRDSYTHTSKQRDNRFPTESCFATAAMLITGYLVAVNALSFTMHAEDKAVATGMLPFLGRVPG